jgi:3-deoxy-D-manno-octulosonic-acid transferase
MRRFLSQRLYLILGMLLAPLLPYYLRKRGQRGKEDLTRMGERFGKASIARPAGKLIWLHAASVGELQSLRVLIQALHQRHPEMHMLVTTGTVTSARLFETMKIPRSIHQFVPLDYYSAIRRFLQHWQPDMALWVESEFWPELLRQTQARRIPSLLVNARISAQSTKRWSNMRALITPLLQGFAAIIASTKSDAERLQILGAAPIDHIANLKFDANILPEDPAALSAFKQQTKTRQLVLAASTHAGEEAILAESIAPLSAQSPDILLVIVPRHANRGDAIAEMLRAQNIRIAQRARGENITAETQIYLADTMNELGMFYRACDIVFIGGSLIAHGGHNMLEAARLSCAIITGVHVFNFADIAANMLQQKALISAQNTVQLQAAFKTLLTDHTARTTLMENAKLLATQGQGAVDIIMAQVDFLIQKTGTQHG